MNCFKCNGTGSIAKFQMFNQGICYNCNGTGKELTKEQKTELKQKAIAAKEQKKIKWNQSRLEQLKEMLEQAQKAYNETLKELETLRKKETLTEAEEETEDNLINNLATYSDMIDQWESKIQTL